MRFSNSMEYLIVLVEIKLLESANNLLLCRTAVLQYCSTSILQYRKTALDFSCLVSLELQFLEIFCITQKGENLSSLRRAPRAQRYSVEIKMLVTEYLNVLGKIKLLERAINLLHCRTSVLQYFNIAVPQNCIRPHFFGLTRIAGS